MGAKSSLINTDTLGGVQRVPPLGFGLHPIPERIKGDAFGREMLDPAGTVGAYAAPTPDKAASAEEVGYDLKGVKPAHILGRSNLGEIGGRREKLHVKTYHKSRRMKSLTI